MLEVDGENSVMGDMATREKIASIPPEIHDPNVLTKIKGECVFALNLAPNSSPNDYNYTALYIIMYVTVYAHVNDTL